ncbi:MAG: hypothetical protein EXS00_00375 [Phycisphaerales bacterium]|nr:hypothetical protein [Phycisphaerales bacterium]
MPHSSLVLASATALLLAGVTHGQAVPLPPAVASGRILVKLTPAAQMGRAALKHEADAVGSLGAALKLIGATDFRPAMSASAEHVEIAQQLGLDRWYQATIPEIADPTAVAAVLKAQCDQVEVAESDPLGELSDLIPNDPLFNLQYALQNTGQLAGTVNADINATGAWSLTTGSPDVVIGFLDGGVAQHSELSGRILPGWNIPTGSDVIIDQCSSHGTHVMGIALAAGNNGNGIAGVNWSAKGMPVIVVTNCTGQESWLADGLIWAVDHGAHVVNMSVQYSTGTTYMHDAVLYGVALDIPMVASTGNSASIVAFPARWAETIAVSGSNQTDTRWASSNYGPEVDIAAPANQVYSCVNTSTYGYKSGTSMAAPHVAGTIALMMAAYPAITSAQVRAALETTAHDIESVGFDNFTGWGRLDAAAAVAAAIALRPVADLDGDGVVSAPDLAILLSAYGACPSCDCGADFNNDCAVDGGDLSELLVQWTAP